MTVTDKHTPEKLEFQHSEGYGEKPIDVEATSPENVPVDYGFDPVMLKKIVRKIDLRLIPILSAMYCISLIDRTNLSLARAANKNAMDIKLGLNVGQRYSIATLIFFIPYIILEVP
jgi:hypothetical protein